MNPPCPACGAPRAEDGTCPNCDYAPEYAGATFVTLED